MVQKLPQDGRNTLKLFQITCSDDITNLCDIIQNYYKLIYKMLYSYSYYPVFTNICKMFSKRKFYTTLQKIKAQGGKCKVPGYPFNCNTLILVCCFDLCLFSDLLDEKDFILNLRHLQNEMCSKYMSSNIYSVSLFTNTSMIEIVVQSQAIVLLRYILYKFFTSNDEPSSDTQLVSIPQNQDKG